jgi:hypothetical protein
VKLFIDSNCAKIDQEMQPHFKNLGKTFINVFTLVVEGATTYVAEVATLKEYIRELEQELFLNPDNEDIKNALNKLKLL